jgi:SAM-dependent methyltransferase
MLRFSRKLAKINNIKISTHLASAENLKLPISTKFDIIYAGNCLHHANIKKSIKEIKKHLKSDGIFISWDPIAYNPIINIYRKIASKKLELMMSIL